MLTYPDTVATLTDGTGINDNLGAVFGFSLHLCGYKDKTDDEAKLMRQKEDESLALLTC